MSIPHTLACMVAVPFIAGAFIPVSQAQASNPMPSCNPGASSTLLLGCTGLSQKQIGKQLGPRQTESYKEAGKPGHDPVILGIAPHDVNLS
jgi:hypothetical protein